jgi:hypothetical protein
MLTLDKIPAPAPGVVGRILETGHQTQTAAGESQDETEAVLVLPSLGKVKVLNEVGARIWSLADGSRDLSAIAGILCQEYQVGQEEAEADVLQFVSGLLESNILILREAYVRE